MLGRQRGSRATRVTHRPLTVASTTMIVGLAGLAVTAVVAVSAVLAAYVDTYVAGLVLGVGVVSTAWAFSVIRHRMAPSRSRVPGRSRTQDCRPARWARPTKPFGSPRLPTEAQRRVRPCPGTRRR